MQQCDSNPIRLLLKKTEVIFQGGRGNIISLILKSRLKGLHFYAIDNLHVGSEMKSEEEK